MISPQESDRIERLKKGLYSRKDTLHGEEDARKSISKPSYEVQEEWQHEDPLIPEPEKPRNSIFVRILLLALLFFVISAGIALYIFTSGANVISPTNVDIVVTSPVSIGGGEILSYEISVQNKNSVDLNTADIRIEYPNGTRNADDVGVDLAHEKESLGGIASGRSVKRNKKAVLFGIENSKQSVVIVLDYSVKGSDTVFSKEKKFEVILTAAPVSVRVKTLKEVVSNQQFTIEVELASNSNLPIDDLILVGEFPFG